MADAAGGSVSRPGRAQRNRLHWVRDLDFDEDRSQIRAATAPRIMASLRNLVVTVWRLAGATNIAATLRHHDRRPSRPLRTIMNG